VKKEFKVLILEDDPFFEISLKYMFLDSVYEIVKVINCQTLLDEWSLYDTFSNFDSNSLSDLFSKINNIDLFQQTTAVNRCWGFNVNNFY
jgi:hypothetical protein